MANKESLEDIDSFHNYIPSAPGSFQENHEPFDALSRLSLQIKCRDLVNPGTTLPNPQIFLFEEDPASDKWREVGRTEMIRATNFPKFSGSILLNYKFQRLRKLRFLVINICKIGGKMEEQHLLGTIETSLAEIVAAEEFYWNGSLKNQGKPAGSIHIATKEMDDYAMSIAFHLHAKRLSRQELFGRSYSFLRIFSQSPSGNWEPMYKTEVAEKTQDPIWEKFSLSAYSLCKNDLDLPLRIECNSWDHSGGEGELIGECTTSVRELQAGMASKQAFPLLDPKKQNKKHYDDSGRLFVFQCEVIKHSTFLEYIRGGLRTNLMVAVDFTASNGDPDFTTSLHYRNPYSPNEYTRAIRSVSEVLAPYDRTQKFPVFGFGAKPHSRHPVSHCFPLNQNEGHPEVEGVQGILEAYNHAINEVVLQGPTNFRDILLKAQLLAESAMETSQEYTVLLIITDGVISDMNATIKEVIKCSSLPISIVIVGVGSADFKKMDILDNNGAVLVQDGLKTTRDIVQFVPFRDVKDSHYTLLAEAILEEIPQQIVGYYRMRNELPNLPPVEKVLPADSSTGNFDFKTVRLPSNHHTARNRTSITEPSVFVPLITPPVTLAQPIQLPSLYEEPNAADFYTPPAQPSYSSHTSTAYNPAYASSTENASPSGSTNTSTPVYLPQSSPFPQAYNPSYLSHNNFPDSGNPGSVQNSNSHHFGSHSIPPQSYGTPTYGTPTYGTPTYGTSTPQSHGPPQAAPFSYGIPPQQGTSYYAPPTTGSVPAYASGFHGSQHGAAPTFVPAYASSSYGSQQQSPYSTSSKPGYLAGI